MMQGVPMRSLLSLGRFTRFWRTLAFVALSAFIVTVGSEKVFWYIQGVGSGWDPVIAVSIYIIPVLVGLWFLARGGTGLPGVVLAGAALGWVMEGVFTPELYGDGPLGPFLPGYFAGWHGLLSVVTLWYLFRKWTVARNRRQLGRVAAAIGVFWGWWSMYYWLPDTINDPELANMGFDAGVWQADKFAVYAFVFGTGLAAAHWLIGYVWPERWEPTRRWTVVTLVVAALISTPVLAAVPWGPAKLGSLLGIVWWANRKRQAGEPTVFPALRGRPPPANVAPILLMPLTASLSYAALLAVRPSDAFISIFSFWIPTLSVAIGGGAAVVWAVRSRRRTTALDVAATARTRDRSPQNQQPGRASGLPQGNTRWRVAPKRRRLKQ